MRVGIVDYLNSRPLAWDFLSGAVADRYEAVYLPPAQVADRLASGELDVGLIPSIEYQRISGLEILPAGCVASDKAVRSVLLVSDVPFGEIRTLALDENSRTSATLVRILLDALYGVRPRAEPARADLGEMLARNDAALLIGDPALSIPVIEGRVLDLAEAWSRLTGLPFVFAFWAIRSGGELPGAELSRIAADFAASLERGRRNLGVLAHEAGRELRLPEEELMRYLRNNLSFTLGPREVAGLEEFYRRAAPYLEGEKLRPLRFLQLGAAGLQEVAR